MRNTLRVLPDTLVRSAALLLGSWGFIRLYEAAMPDPIGADIGEGLLQFALLIMAAAGWAAWDASQRGLPPVALTWVATGLLTSVGMGLVVGSTGSWQDVIAHLGAVDLFWAGLVAVPALLSAGTVAGARAAVRAASRPAARP